MEGKMRMQEAFQRFMGRKDVKAALADRGEEKALFAELFGFAVRTCAEFVESPPRAVRERVGYDFEEGEDFPEWIAEELRALTKWCDGGFQGHSGTAAKCRYLQHDDCGGMSCNLIEVWGDATDCPHHARKATKAEDS